MAPGRRPLALPDENQGATDQAEDHRQVAVRFPHRDLIDGNLPQLAQTGPTETPPQALFMDVLDGIPAVAQVPGVSWITMWAGCPRA